MPKGQSSRPAIRVLSVVPRGLYPFHSGGEIRVGALMRHLMPGYEFTVLTFFESGGERQQAAAALELERRYGIQSIFCRRTPGLAPDPSKPAIAAGFWDPSMAKALRAAIVERSIDLVQLEFTQMAQYAEHAADLAPVVLTEHDSSILAPGESYFRTGDDGVAHARLARAHLAACFVHCRRVVALSAADAARLEPLAGPGKLRVVPTGAEIERLAFKPLAGRRAESALFIGHYPHFPNEDAAVFLCREVLPRLKRSVAGARVELVGSSPTAAVRALAGPDVEIVGTVADVAPYLWRAGLFIAPMRRGFGIKGKVLEAFSAGVPVVATPEACEAMPGLRDGRDLLLARGPEELAAAAARVIGDRPLAGRLARAARRFVAENFGWERQARLLDAVLREALVAALLLASALARPCAATEPAGPDNVLLIVVDSLRQDRLSAYGNPRRTSPTLDALARDGALFLNAEAASNWTLPSLATIMTSLHPTVHGALKPPRGRPGWAQELEQKRFEAGPGGKLDASRPTLAGTLRDAGWTTAGIVSGGFCQSAFGFGSGFQSYRDTGVKLEELNDRYILPWIKEHRREKFFLYIHAGDVHDPYDTTPHYNRLWDPGYKGTVDGSRATLDDINEGRRPLPARDLRRLLALYDGGISYTDAQIARIIAQLKAHGLYRRTLIVVTSDHGEAFREHGNIMQHGRSAYETELRVPLIMRVPGRKAGVRVADVTPAVDIAPTVLDALGVRPPPSFQGRSALARLDGAPGSTDEAYAFSLTSGLFTPSTAAVVRKGRWKLIRPEEAKFAELYDLASDPDEKADLALARPEVAARLGLELDAQEKRNAAAAAALPPLAPGVPLPRDLDAELRSSGYIE